MVNFDFFVEDGMMKRILMAEYAERRIIFVEQK